MKVKIAPRKMALLIIDMQNDWILKEGAAARLGSISFSFKCELLQRPEEAPASVTLLSQTASND